MTIMAIKLQEGEQVLFESKPERTIVMLWVLKIMLPITFVILCFGLPMMFGIISEGHDLNCIFWTSVILTLVFYFMLFIIVPFYYSSLRETFQYYITNQRCIFEGGIIVKRTRSVPFHKITDIEINQNIIERFFGLCSLKIFTPGTGSAGAVGFEQAEIKFSGLKEAETPANIIQGILKNYKATGE